MIELETKIRKWGNSFGIVVPFNKIKTENMQEGEEITAILIKKKTNLRKLWGAHKFNKSTEQIMREIDKDLWPNGE